MDLSEQDRRPGKCSGDTWWLLLLHRVADKTWGRAADSGFLNLLTSLCLCSVQKEDRGRKKQRKMRTRTAQWGQYGNSWGLLCVWHEKPWELRKTVLAYLGLGAVGISVTVGWKGRSPKVQRLMERRQSRGCLGQNWEINYWDSWWNRCANGFFHVWSKFSLIRKYIDNYNYKVFLSHPICPMFF